MEDGFLRDVSWGVRARRRVLRLDQRALATKAGVSKSTLARLEAGDGNVSMAALRKVLTAVGLAVALTREDGTPWLAGEALATDIQGVTDRAGRSFPAHLPAAPTGSLASWDFGRDRRWPVRPRSAWRYDRWHDQVEALVAEMHALGELDHDHCDAAADADAAADDADHADDVLDHADDVLDDADGRGNGDGAPGG